MRGLADDQGVETAYPVGVDAPGLATFYALRGCKDAAGHKTRSSSTHKVGG